MYDLGGESAAKDAIRESWQTLFITSLRAKFEEEHGIPWENQQGEPDIDYVQWLENEVWTLAVALKKHQ